MSAPQIAQALASAELLQILAVVLGPAGAAWAGVKVSLNGTRERVKRIEDKVDDLIDTKAEVGERIARLEAKVK